MLPSLVFDIETYSRAELADVGAYIYSLDPSTDVLVVSWVYLDADGVPTGEPETWRPGQPPPKWPGEERYMWAWNVDFDRAIVAGVLAVRYGWALPAACLFRCLMARAAYANLPLGLAGAGAVLAAEHRKDADGHRAMMRLAKPARATVRNNDPKRAHTPEALDALAGYCRQDVRAEACLVRLLPSLPAQEEATFALDRIINARGVEVDLALVVALRDTAATLAESLREEFATATGGAVERETQLAKLGDWLRANGVAVATGKGAMDKVAVAAILASIENVDTPAGERVRRALRIRQAIGRSAHAKFAAILSAAPDGRLRGAVQYGGAHQTLRWAGRQVQTQNMPKGILGSKPADGPTYAAARALLLAHPGDVALLTGLYGDGTEPIKTAQLPGLPAVLSSLLRCCFVASTGKILIVADFAAVEAWGVLWLANDATGLDAARHKRDLYRMAAGKILGVEPDDVSKADRNGLGKPTVLGSGYGMGPDKFAATFNLSVAIGTRAVQAYRTTFPGVPALWKSVERAAVAAIRTPGLMVAVGGIVAAIKFHFNGRHLLCKLPSGRCLTYRDACLVPGRFEGTTVVEFAYEDLTSRQWVRGTTWGGSFVENLVQAICRDLLAFAMHGLEAEGLPVVLHIHDEVLVEADEPPRGAGYDAALAALVHRVERIICRLPPWAAGFPLRAEGFASAFWRK